MRWRRPPGTRWRGARRGEVGTNHHLRRPGAAGLVSAHPHRPAGGERLTHGRAETGFRGAPQAGPPGRDAARVRHRVRRAGAPVPLPRPSRRSSFVTLRPRAATQSHHLPADRAPVDGLPGGPVPSLSTRLPCGYSAGPRAAHSCAEGPPEGVTHAGEPFPPSHTVHSRDHTPRSFRSRAHAIANKPRPPRIHGPSAPGGALAHPLQPLCRQARPALGGAVDPAARGARSTCGRVNALVRQL